MTKKASLASALLCCFIWGTTFIAQDTGMDNIGPYTFNGVRFMVGFFALLPIFLLIEKKNFTSEFNKDKKKICIFIFFNWYFSLSWNCFATSCSIIHRYC